MRITHENKFMQIVDKNNLWSSYKFFLTYFNKYVREA